MSVIAVVNARDIHDESELATSRGKNVVGYTYNGAHYCPECARNVTVQSSDGEEYAMTDFPDGEHDSFGSGVGKVRTDERVDYPGGTCTVCLQRLDTRINVYNDGGAHPEPVLEIQDPGTSGETVHAFFRERSNGEILVMFAEDLRTYCDAGTKSWVSEEDVVDGLQYL